MRVEGVRLSLWRAAALYRAVTVLFCDYLIFVRWPHLYAHPAAAFAVGAGMTVWTVLLAWVAVTGRAHRLQFVIADAAVTAALTVLTVTAQTAEQRQGGAVGMPTLTTLWAAGPVLEAGIVAGWVAGVVFALVQTAATVAVHVGYDGHTVLNGVTLVVAGAVVGYVATLAVRSERELAAALGARAALAERERLARTVHDGVLQVLGLVSRTGVDESGEHGRLAREAARQEARLRALITSRAGSGEAPVALVDALRALRSERVSVATPSTLPQLPATVGAEIAAAVQAALHNVERHAGADARAWVLVEELDDCLRVTVRDDGAGFAVGRLAEAARAGRLGIASSVRGRVEQLGGAVTISSAPGEGTTVELEVPLTGVVDPGADR